MNEGFDNEQTVVQVACGRSAKNIARARNVISVAFFTNRQSDTWVELAERDRRSISDADEFARRFGFELDTRLDRSGFIDFLRANELSDRQVRCLRRLNLLRMRRSEFIIEAPVWLEWVGRAHVGLMLAWTTAYTLALLPVSTELRTAPALALALSAGAVATVLAHATYLRPLAIATRALARRSP